MTHNDCLRSLRYILNLRDQDILKILEGERYLVTPEEVMAYTRKEEDEGYLECPEEALAYFLNGMVALKRGKEPKAELFPIELPVSNNLILKKIRVAFQLKDTDIITLIERHGLLKVSKAEIGAIFRNRDHSNYRECGDQYLRAVLKSLGDGLVALKS